MKFITLPILLIRLNILAITAAILCADYYTGPDIRFTILYVIPVAYAAWQWRFRWALALALIMPLIRLAFGLEWKGLSALFAAAINTAIQWSTLISISILISRMVALQKRVRVLEGILPICSFCKKIRDRDENWEKIEDYITSHSGALFTHGLCPTCMRQHYPEVFEQRPPS